MPTVVVLKVVELILADQFMTAIKLVRETTQWDLRMCKHYCDAIRDTHRAGALAAGSATDTACLDKIAATVMHNGCGTYDRCEQIRGLLEGIGYKTRTLFTRKV